MNTLHHFCSIAIIISTLTAVNARAFTEQWSYLIGQDGASQTYGVTQLAADGAGGVFVVWRCHLTAGDTNVYHVTYLDKKGAVAWDGTITEPVYDAAIVGITKKNIFVNIKSSGDYLIVYDRKTGTATRMRAAEVYVRYGTMPGAGSAIDKKGFFVNKYFVHGGTNVILRYTMK